MIHPSTEVRFINKDIGYGLFATQKIPKGTITFAQDDLDIEITQKQLNKLDSKHQEFVDKYAFRDKKGRYIVSWDNGKYVNHNCNPNTMSTGYGFEIALRDIEKFEEITDEYGLFNVDEEFSISCGDTNCRKIIKPNDIDTYQDIWDRKVKEALKSLRNVEQPLIEFLDVKTGYMLNGYLDGQIPYITVQNLSYKPLDINA